MLHFISPISYRTRHCNKYCRRRNLFREILPRPSNSVSSLSQT